MRILVFGASGRTGQEVVRFTLNDKIKIRAFVRDPLKIKTHDINLENFKGDVLNSKDTDRAMEGIDAVIVTLGPKPDTKINVLTLGSQNIISSMKKKNIKRLIVQSAYALSGSSEGMQFLQGTPPDILEKMKPAIDDKIGQEKLVKDSGLDWTIVRPLMLNNGPKTGLYRSGIDLDIKRTDVISRADVADFILKSLEDTSTFGKIITLAD